MALSITQLVRSNRENEGEWFQYGDTSFHVKLAFYGRKQMQELQEQSRRKRPNPMNPSSFTNEVDNEVFREKWTPMIIKDWKGLTFEVLSKLILIGEVKGDTPSNEEVPFSIEDAKMLVKESTVFDVWVTTMCSDVETYNKARREAQEKNSSTVSGLNSPEAQNGVPAASTSTAP